MSCATVLLMLTFNEEEESVRVKRGKTRTWIKRREEKGYFNNIVEGLRVEEGLRDILGHFNGDRSYFLARWTFTATR